MAITLTICESANIAVNPVVPATVVINPALPSVSATVTVGTTTTGAPGTDALVVNSGTPFAAVLDFTIPEGIQGIQGPAGSAGAPGAAATIAAGTTTTLSPGSSATVTNAGTSSAAVFNFGIPAGQTGATGATGATGETGPGVATGGTTGQLLTKVSGTNYDTTWTTVIPGDRYLTTSTTSNTLSNTTKTFTIGTGLSYTPTQNITISYDASNHMHGEVLTYNSGTGVLTVDIKNHTGTGTYTAWVVNVGGVTPATSVDFSDITGAVSGNINLQTALDDKLSLTGGTMSGDLYLPTIKNILNTDIGIDVYNDSGAGTHYIHTFSAYGGTFNLATNGAGLTFPDLTTQSTAFPGFTGYAPLDAPSFTSGITVDATGITFSDSSVQTTAAVAGANLGDAFTLGKVQDVSISSGYWIITFAPVNYQVMASGLSVSLSDGSSSESITSFSTTSTWTYTTTTLTSSDYIYITFAGQRSQFSISNP